MCKKTPKHDGFGGGRGAADEVGCSGEKLANERCNLSHKYLLELTRLSSSGNFFPLKPREDPVEDLSEGRI